MAGSIPGPELRIVLVGQTRSGKSTTGNTILGREVFECGILFKSVTQTCQKEEAQLKGRKVVVVDTPGFSHTDRPEEDIAAEVRKCVKFCSPGPHIILQVMYPFYSSQRDTYVVQQIKEIFGLEAKDYTIILFTRRDGMRSKFLKDFLTSKDENLNKYIAECGNRCLAFNNMAEGAEREAEVAELMTMIDDLVRKNKSAPYYTEDMMNVNKRHNF